MKTRFIANPLANFKSFNLKGACSSILLLATVLTSGLVQAQQDTFLETVDEFLYASGSDEELAKFPQSLMAQVDQQLVQGGIFDMNDPVQTAIVTRLRSELSVLFTEQNLRRTVVNSLEDSASIESLKRVTAFYKSPLGELGKKYAKASNNLMEDPAFQRFSQQFESMSKDKIRSELGRNFIELYKLHEFLVDIGIDSQIASMMGMIDNVSEQFNANGNFRQQVNMSMERMDSMREPAYDGAFSLVQAMEYYRYRDMDIQDLVDYTDFHSTPEAVSVNNALMNGMRNFTIDAFYVVGGAIAEEMNKVRLSSAEQ